VIHADSLRLDADEAAEQMYARMRRDMREAGLAAERRLRALERFAAEVRRISEAMSGDVDPLISRGDLRTAVLELDLATS
jgi:hypothetical protein